MGLSKENNVAYTIVDESFLPHLFKLIFNSY